ncbi:hypothetical protein Tco_0660871 [Tanacetum coccineum]
MELESTNSGPTAKLPILKLGEYKMWAIRIKQYFQIQDYALWEVIENGDSWVSISQTTEENGKTVTKMSTPATAEEKTKKKNDVKARGLLLMALPNEHQLTFSQYPDAKYICFYAIETRIEASEDSPVGHATLGVIIAQEDLNLKFLSSLPPEWNTHIVVWMNKPEIETMSIDDLYNKFKIKPQKDKKTVVHPVVDKSKVECCTTVISFWDTFARECLEASISKKIRFDVSDRQKNKSDNIALNGVLDSEAINYKRGLDTVEAQLVTYRKNEVLFSEEVVVLKREVGCKQYEINILKIEFEKVKQEKDDNEFKIEKFDKASKDLDQLLESQITDKRVSQPEFEVYGLRANKSVCENSSNETKKNSDAPLIKEWVSDNEDEVESPIVVEKKTVVPTIPKVDVVRPKQQENSVRKTVRYVEMYRSQKPRGNQRN